LWIITVICIDVALVAFRGEYAWVLGVLEGHC